MQAYRGLIDAAVAAGIPEDTILDLRGNHDVSSPCRPWKHMWAMLLKSVIATTYIHLILCMALHSDDAECVMETWDACFILVVVPRTLKARDVVAGV